MKTKGIRASYITKEFYTGILKLKELDPEYTTIFAEVPEIEDKQCEDYAIWALVETIAVIPPLTPEKLNFTQRLCYLGPNEVEYLTRFSTYLCWKKVRDLWIFWVIDEDKTKPNIEKYTKYGFSVDLL